MNNKLSVVGSGIDGLSHQDILLFVISHFSADLIGTLNTSQIITDNSVVHIGKYTHPEPKIYAKKDFQMILDTVSEKQKWEILDGVAAGINYGDTIVLYNQDYVFELYSVMSGKTLQESEIAYLEGLPSTAVPKAYKIGVVSHELGHSIYAVHIRDTQLEKERKYITDNFGPVTPYVQEYAIGDEIFYEENFTESLRIYTTNPCYLKIKCSHIYSFLRHKIPGIYQ